MAARSPSLGTSSIKPSTSHTSHSKRKPPRAFSMDLPARFQEDDDDDEVEDDAAQVDENVPEAYVQQSMYGFIAAAQQSKRSLAGTLQPDSESETESEGEGEGDTHDAEQKTVPPTTDVSSRRRSKVEQTASQFESSRQHRKKGSEGKLLRSFLKPSRVRSDSQSQDAMSQSQFLPPRETFAVSKNPLPSPPVHSDAPVMDSKLKAQARAGSVTLTAATVGSKSKTIKHTDNQAKRTPIALSAALADIFHFDEPEEVISEYACWYLQSVLLQGYMYITQKHICFYAYLQRKGNAVLKSGHLAKQGKRNPRFRRYWFTLKGDVLSYFNSAAEPYFPNGTIDLRYGIAADLVPEREKDIEPTTFTITTDKRTYHFRADSGSSAKEWVRQVQKVIFRSHNDGDSVKISLPIDNVVDVETNPVIDFAETVKLRVIDNEETFAVDEYFFTFFKYGKDALNVLQLMTQDNEAKKAALESEGVTVSSQKTMLGIRKSVSIERSPRVSPRPAPAISEPVRSTLSPLSTSRQASPRPSGEYTHSSGELSRNSSDHGRASFDRGRRSASGARVSSSQWRRASRSPLSPSAQESTESFHTTSEHASFTSIADGDGMDMSASQVLTGDRMFRTPTLRIPQPKRTTSGSTVERLRRESREQSPHNSSQSSEEQHGPTNAPKTVTEQGVNTDLAGPGRTSTDRQRADDYKTRQYTISGPSLSKRAIATPLQHAFTLAGVVRDHSKRMSSYISSSPKNYYDKFSGAIAGGKRHYSEADGLASEDRIDDGEDYIDTAEHERRFQQHFALPNTERLRAVFYCWLHRVLPLYGKIYISDRRFCFRSLLYGTRTKLVVPFREVDNVAKERGFRWGYPGMVLVIRGHEELFFDFGSAGLRDDCVVTVLRGLDIMRSALESFVLTDEEKLDAEEAAAENTLLQDARVDDLAKHDSELVQSAKREAQSSDAPPMLFDDPNASVLDFRPKTSMRITCLTIGSRGDVQPYIALCKGFLADGHQAKIATHRPFEQWITGHGIEFAAVEGDPAELMRLCVENGMFTPSFLFEANSKSRQWLDGLLSSAWEACQDSDILIESPSAMAGLHIAEALGIPYFRAFTMPWTKTRAYPHAFAVPNSKKGGQYNYYTYTLFDNLFWTMTSGQINRWRRVMLGLQPTDQKRMQANKIPFLYNFSPNVVVPPLDFSDWIRITGYWFLDEAKDWVPPADLVTFIKQARDDGMKIVYIGFGSVPVSDSKQLTQQIVDAVVKADVCCILSKGWSDHFTKVDPSAPEVALPSCIFQIRSAPHDWLFKQIDAAVHHGGAGTTGASLRAGIPTVVKPFFGDQFFFATRIEDLGVGYHLKKITVNALGKAIWIATHDERMRTKAKALGEKIRAEDGVSTAINAIYRDMEYAKTLVKKRGTKAVLVSQVGGRKAGAFAEGVEDEEDPEESWTFIERESDVDITASRRGSELRPQGARQWSLGSRVLKGAGGE